MILLKGKHISDLLNVHGSLELMLSIHSRVEEAPIAIDISYGLYNFIDLKDL